ncbi:MAG: hypothetical protein IJ137_01235 [Eubacterium sp.]|nr:hypothetical protein [Eubacterium sp.]
MSQIVISAQELDRKRESLSQLKTKLSTQITNFEKAAKKLDSMWDGPARMKYAAAITVDIAKLKLLLKIIGEFLSILKKIIDLYNTMEKKNIATASS